MSERPLTITERLAGAVLARDGIASPADARFAAAYPAAVAEARQLAEAAGLEAECEPVASHDPPVMQDYPRFCWSAFSDGKRWGWAQANAERDDAEVEREDRLIAALIDAGNALDAVNGRIHNPSIGITYDIDALCGRIESQLAERKQLRQARRDRIERRGPRGI